MVDQCTAQVGCPPPGDDRNNCGAAHFDYTDAMRSMPHGSLVVSPTKGRFPVHLQRYLPLVLVAAALTSGTLLSAPQVETPPDVLIGYTEHRTDLPGGRHANIKTRRAVIVKADGTGRRVLAEELTREADYSTPFAGWSKDGKAALLSRCWKTD